MKRKQHILLVDDEPSWLNALSMVLVSRGYEVRGVKNAAEALASLAQFKPDLIVSDVRMPDMNGFDFLDRIKQNPSVSATPVVFLSAIDDFHARKVARDLGAADFLLKPVDEEQMLAALQKYLPE